MPKWVTMKEWEGTTVAVLGSGPSMTVEVAETARKSGCKVIAVNNQAIKTNGHAARAPWADILYAADSKWWYENRVAIQDFKGRKVTITQNNGTAPNVVADDVLILGNGGPSGVDDRAGYVKTGHNSGFQAVALAYNLGAHRIVLCGFDMHAKNGEHWFGHHRWRKGYASRYDIFIRAFEQAAPEYLRRGIEIINATPGSALKCFKTMELEEALNAVRSMRKSPEADAFTGAETARRDRAQQSSGAAESAV